MKNSKSTLRMLVLHSLKRGTGEAYLLVRDYPEVDFSNQVIKAALNLYAYDGQSEQERAQYIYDIINITGQKDKIRKAVLKGLYAENQQTWNLTHLFALTKRFAEDGNTEARNAIYNRFLKDPIPGAEWIGYKEIVELDALEGLFYIAEKYGQHLEDNPDDWQDDSIIDEFQEGNKHLNVYEELKSKAKSNKHIALYLKTITKTKNLRQKRKRTAPVYEDINQLAKQLMVETDESRIIKLLSVFDSHKFPDNPHLILDLAIKHTGTQISMNAISALKYLSSNAIRKFAIDNIQKYKKPLRYLEILTSNYRINDYKLLRDIALKFNNEHDIEALAIAFSSIYKANKTKKCKAPIEVLYQKMNCAIHRHDLVEILIENEVLSDKIKNEIRFDCNPEIRSLLKSEG